MTYIDIYNDVKNQNTRFWNSISHTCYNNTKIYGPKSPSFRHQPTTILKLGAISVSDVADYLYWDVSWCDYSKRPQQLYISTLPSGEIITRKYLNISHIDVWHCLTKYDLLCYEENVDEMNS